MKSWTRWVWLVGLLGLLVGCGPVQYASNILDATAAIENARNTRAWKWACFEYYAALQYYVKAQEEAGFSDFEAATDMAKRAVTYAKSARTISLRQRRPVVACKIPKAMEAKYKKALARLKAKQ